MNLKNNFRFFLFLLPFILCTSNSTSAQSTAIDSLVRVVKAGGEDTAAVNTCNELCRKLWMTGNYNHAMIYANIALTTSKKLYFSKGISISCINIGIINDRIGNYPEALKTYLLALSMLEKTNDLETMAMVYNNIGNNYARQQNYEDALKNYNASLKIKIQSGNKEGMAYSFDNIGIVHWYRGNYAEALNKHMAALEIRKELNDKQNIAYTTNNIGNVYYAIKNYTAALAQYEICFKISAEVGDKQGMTAANINMGDIYIILKKIGEARKCLNEAMSLAIQNNSKENIKFCFYNLSRLDSSAGNYKHSFSYYKSYIAYSDSLVNEENTKKNVQAQMNYEFEKKENATKAEQEKKDAITEEEKQKQKIVRNSFIGGFMIVLLLAILILQGYRNKQKANLVISKQKEEVEKAKEQIEEQKKEVEMKQKEILDSIHYAQRIQKAQLTNENYIKKNLERLMK